MRFKAKLRKIGNSIGVLIPLKVITGFNLGEEIWLEVITNKEKEQEVITNLNPVEYINEEDGLYFNENNL